MTAAAAEGTTESMAQIIRSSLQLNERCDQCGAVAWVEAEIMTTNEAGVRSKSILFFCVHDFDAKPSLALAASRIVDHREALYRLEGRTS